MEGRQRTKLDRSFCCASAISSQVPLADREPQPSLRVWDMEDSGMLVAEEPDGCLDEFPPPHTWKGGLGREALSAVTEQDSPANLNSTS